MKSNVTIRYCGNENFSRRFLLERQDGTFYTGRGWTTQLAQARLYDKLSSAQRAYRAVMNRKYRKQPTRQFRLQIDLNVRGSGRFSADDLRRFLSLSLQISFDTAAGGDGPNGTFVQATAALWSVQEIYADSECRSADAAH
jgi:hypothetical protein